MTQGEIKKGVRILMAGEDAKLFILYQKNRDKFIELLKAGVFELDSGRVEINVNNNQIQSIFLHKMTFKRDAKIDIIPT